MTLADAPKGLQSAVQASLARPVADRGGSPRRAKLTASDGTAGDEFGFSSAVFRSTAVVGARGKNSAMGAAYVFVYTSAGWVQQAELIAHDGALQDYFGWAVAISGSTAVIGAPYRNFGTGAVYVFVRSGDTWSEQAELRAPDGSEYDHFGWSVAVFRTSLVVGAFGKNTNTGAAYVFVRSGDTWSQQAELTASDGATFDLFGTSVGLFRSTAVVGAYGKNSNTGAAYVFVRSGGTWSQQAELTASDGATFDWFGTCVAISGSTVAVGAPLKNFAAGAAYVFVRSGDTWSQQAELAASDGTTNDDLGISVAIFRSTAVVGASGKNASNGAAYMFVRSGDTWSQQAELTAPDGAAGDDFGISVAIFRSTAVVGAYGDNASRGAAYVFAPS